MPDTNGAAQAERTNGAGNVRPTDITQEMQVAYLDYAMSVIVARALPDVRDGLKPVHRRILYAMWHDLSLTYDKPHKKSARIVGEVLGKYHPHGDTAVYDAMVRMAQDFSLRYPLVDGQGNFGSIDGDNAAAMRYTEARLAKISNLMLEDLEKETVEWHPNFDNTLREPDILPAALPNLLINGSSGIAVGMATNIPPHNLGEVVDALLFLIERFDKVDDITTEQLMQFVKGPDFPTGGIVYRYREEGKGEEDADAVAQGYSLGKSRLIMQAKAHFEEISRGRTRIIVTELPYQTNKTTLIERIADLVRDGKIEGITDLRDESDRTGMRIVIELNRNVEPKDILANLYKYTPLQQTFGMQMLALVDGQPRLLSLKRMLQLFIQHRQEIIRRRSKFDLKRARERAHIVEGLLRALDILDEVIATIRRSHTVDTARKNLMADFKFSELQAQAILDMQLRRLAALERKRLQEEFDELKQRIAYLEDLLAHPPKILGVIKDELVAIKEEYGDARRTQIVDRTRGALTTHDLLPDQIVWVSLSKSGDLRRQPVTKAPTSVLRQIGKNSQVALLTANTRDLLYVFSGDGRCSRIGIHEIPDDGNSKPVHELTDFQARDPIIAAIALPREKTNGDAGYFFLVTEQAVVKRIAVSDVQTTTGGEFIVMNVESGDRLGWAILTQGNQEVLLVSADGQSIRFNEEEVRSMGLPAGGVGGMKVRGKDKIIFAGAVEADGELLTVTAAGFAKRSALTEYSSQGRNGAGIVAHKVGERTGSVVAAQVVSGQVAREMVILVTTRGTAMPTALSDVPAMGRSVLGKKVINTAEKDVVTAVWRLGGAAPEAETPAPRRKQAGKPAVPVGQNELLEAPPVRTPRQSKATVAPELPLVAPSPTKSPAPAKAQTPPTRLDLALAPAKTTAPAKPPATPTSAKPAPSPAKTPPAAKTLPPAKPQKTPASAEPAPVKPEVPEVVEPLAPTFDFVQEEPPKEAATPKAARKLQAVVSVNRTAADKGKGKKPSDS